MRIRTLLLLVASLVLVGCMPDSVSPPDQACTEIGCVNMLTVDVQSADIEPGADYEVEFCVDGDCRASTVTVDEASSFGQTDGLSLRADEDVVEYQLPGEEYGETAEVSFSLMDADGTVLASADGEEVPMERSQPNGPGCPPICFTGRLTT